MLCFSWCQYSQPRGLVVMVMVSAAPGEGSPRKCLNKRHPGEGSEAQKRGGAHCCVPCCSLLAACLITGREFSPKLTRFMSSAMLGRQGPVRSFPLPSSLAPGAECRWSGTAHLSAPDTYICSLTELYLSFCWYFPKLKAGI